MRIFIDLKVVSEMSKDSTEKITCGRESCINYRNGYCALKNPERDDNNCLHYEDIMSALRLKVNPFRGIL